MTLNHKEPDKIPLDIGSTKMSGISMNAYKSLIKHKGWETLDNDPKILDPVQQLALHNIQADVPPRNIEAMIDTLYKYGIY